MITLERMNVQKIVTTEEQAERLVSLGYKKLKEKKETINDNGESDKKDLSTMTVDQLKAICKENNLEGYSKMGKEDLVSFIETTLNK